MGFVEIAKNELIAWAKNRSHNKLTPLSVSLKIPLVVNPLVPNIISQKRSFAIVKELKDCVWDIVKTNHYNTNFFIDLQCSIKSYFYLQLILITIHLIHLNLIKILLWKSACFFDIVKWWKSRIKHPTIFHEQNHSTRKFF